jgi:hypothetical protein
MTPRTQETELLDVSLSAMGRAKKVKTDEVRSAQDAMLNMRVEWEELQSRLRNRKIDGFEPAVDAMVQLAATTLAMAAALQAKILNQRIRQAEADQGKEDPIKGVIKMTNEFAASHLGKQRKKKQSVSTK